MAWLWPRHQIPIAFNAVYVALFVFLRSRPSQQKPSGTAFWRQPSLGALYKTLGLSGGFVVETMGFEPTTSAMRVCFAFIG
jgi:hypothetical protein